MDVGGCHALYGLGAGSAFGRPGRHVCPDRCVLPRGSSRTCADSDAELDRLFAASSQDHAAAAQRIEEIRCGGLLFPAALSYTLTRGCRSLAAEGADEKALFRLSAELSGIMCALIAPADLPPVLERLLPFLSDVDHYGAAGACLVVNGAAPLRGSRDCAHAGQGCSAGAAASWRTAWPGWCRTCWPRPPRLAGSRRAATVVLILSQAREHTASGGQHALRTLARHHTAAVLDAILTEKVPLARCAATAGALVLCVDDVRSPQSRAEGAADDRARRRAGRAGPHACGGRHGQCGAVR
jgi:hypothetical protein